MATDLGFSAAFRLFGMIAEELWKSDLSAADAKLICFRNQGCPHGPRQHLSVLIEARQMTPAVLEKTHAHALAYGQLRRAVPHHTVTLVQIDQHDEVRR